MLTQGTYAMFPSKQAINQATWKTSPTWRSPIFSKQDTLSTHTMIYRKNKARQGQCRQRDYQYSIWYMHILLIQFFPPGDQYRKTVASAAHRTEIEILLLSISEKEIDRVMSPVVRQCVSHGSCLFHPEIGCWRHHWKRWGGIGRLCRSQD